MIRDGRVTVLGRSTDEPPETQDVSSEGKKARVSGSSQLVLSSNRCGFKHLFVESFVVGRGVEKEELGGKDW